MSILNYIDESISILNNLDHSAIQGIIDALRELKLRQGRLFILGVGGSAANASHAVNDFRKLCSIDAYAPTDNVSELTARTNDDGWDVTFYDYLRVSNVATNDAVLVLSVGGGNEHLSANIARAVIYANQSAGCKVLGITGPSGGVTAENATAIVKIPTHKDTTPHVEGITMVILHLIVTELRNG